MGHRTNMCLPSAEYIYLSQSRIGVGAGLRPGLGVGVGAGLIGVRLGLRTGLRLAVREGLVAEWYQKSRTFVKQPRPSYLSDKRLSIQACIEKHPGKHGVVCLQSVNPKGGIKREYVFDQNTFWECFLMPISVKSVTNYKYIFD